MYVTDTPLSRKNHDASLKHQGNLKRFLRDLHRANERTKSATENAKREVARLNNLAGTPSASSSSSSSSTIAAPRPPPPRPVNALSDAERKRQMKELESLGVALPDDYRAEMAMMGEWKSTEAPAVTEKKMTEKERVQEEIKKDLKRKFDEEEKEKKWKALDEDEKAIRGFKIQTKTYPMREDPTGLETLLKGKEDSIKEECGTEDTKSAIRATDSLPGDGIKQAGDEGAAVEIKKEEGASEVVFKKRKAKNIRKK